MGLSLGTKPATLPAPGKVGLPSSPTSTPGSPLDAVPSYLTVRQPYAMPLGASPDQFSSPIYGYSPQQLEGAYGMNNVYFGGIKGDGAGQTVAIVDVGDNPSFLQSNNPNYTSAVASALYYYDKYWNIPDPTTTGSTFLKYDEYGNALTDGVDTIPNYSGWAIEEAIDIEAVHLMAPAANIDLVEAYSSSFYDLMQADYTAATLPGVSVVSNSFGGYLEYFGEGYFENQLDQEYLLPALAANPNVTFMASTGDGGAFPNSLIYPSSSPYVVGVGGTAVYVNSLDQWTSETGWSGSGGGISNNYSEPVWQQPFQSTGARTDPDISADADPYTGLATYDPFDFGASTPWDEYGGTSLSVQLSAGMLAVANQGRSLAGFGALEGATSPVQTTPSTQSALYALAGTPELYSADYHDITEGNNFFYSAGPGYDFVTGIGSPKSPTLLPNLAAYDTATQLSFATEPPASVIPGAEFGAIIEATNSFGAPDVAQNGEVELSGTDGLSYYSTMTAGVAVFDDISLASLGTYDYTASFLTSSLNPATSTDVTVVTPTPGVNYYYPLPIYGTPDGPGDLYDAVNAVQRRRRHECHRAFSVNHSL